MDVEYTLEEKLLDAFDDLKYMRDITEILYDIKLMLRKICDAIIIEEATELIVASHEPIND